MVIIKVLILYDFSQLHIECLVQKFLKIVFVLFSNWNVNLFVKDDPVSFNHLNLIEVDDK